MKTFINNLYQSLLDPFGLETFYAPFIFWAFFAFLLILIEWRIRTLRKKEKSSAAFSFRIVQVVLYILVIIFFMAHEYYSHDYRGLILFIFIQSVPWIGLLVRKMVQKYDQLIDDIP